LSRPFKPQTGQRTPPTNPRSGIGLEFRMPCCASIPRGGWSFTQSPSNIDAKRIFPHRPNGGCGLPQPPRTSANKKFLLQFQQYERKRKICGNID
jgi:hypothetical protein